MGLSDDGEDSGTTEQRYEELCLDLNLDTTAKDEAWQSYARISTNYTLEGDGMHWLACALYVACRKSVVPTVSTKSLVEGNCVSLTRLLRSAQLSLINFFNKMKKWEDMANLPQEFRDKRDRLERNFAVSTVIFKKFEPIFLDMFRNPADDPPRQPRSRKQRRLPCTVTDMFKFCWTMFVQVKGNFPAISDDLVNSYHLILCCIDWFYTNALLSDRRDLLNPQFSCLPDNFQNKDYKPPTEVPCIIQALCEKHDGLVVEAKGIKEHWWKPYIKKLYDKKVLKGKVENLTGVLEIGNFEASSKAINNNYEEYVLNVGDFDERIFLGDDASVEIGTPQKPTAETVRGEISKMQRKKTMEQQFETRSLAPSTPLTGRRYLKEKEAPVTPVSTATQSVSRLQALLSGRKTCPSDALISIFQQCKRNPNEEIVKRVKEMGEIFCNMYAQRTEDHPGFLLDFARKRLQLGESLYYKLLENITMMEYRRLSTKEKTVDLSNLLEQDVFHRSLFACCLEIVIFSYNSQRIFPWIIEMFELPPIHFYKVIEVLIRAEDGLSRDVVKHLNHIEETILESLGWKMESPLWTAIQEADGKVPMCEDVTLPNQMEKDSGSNESDANQSASIVGSPPLVNPAIRRIVGEGRSGNAIPRKELLQSPPGMSAADRFSSPTPGSAKRRLFSSGAVPGNATTLATPSPTSVENPPAGTSNQSQPVIFQQAQMEDGRQVLIPVQIVQSPSAGSSSSQSNAKPAEGSSASSDSTQASGSSQSDNKPRRTGSLALFFRKFYHLASVRLRDLCERLDIDAELRQQIWTCFEHCVVHHTELQKERHLDQLIMCAIYVMSKVTGKDKSFQDIMKNYRLQPQAKSHVYRSVLLSSRKRHTSGSSEGSKNDASGSSSPVGTKEEEKKKEEKSRKDKLSIIRSPSTLPEPEPNSQPPTPTKAAGTGSSFEFEDRGDLIKFYNSVYVEKTKNFALKFSVKNQEKGNNVPPLSPLPLVRPQPTSPRRVSTKHPVYISPHKTSAPANTLTPHSKMLYCFNKSPAKDLQKINSMLRKGDDSSQMKAGKRLLEDSGENSASSGGNLTHKRLKQIFMDRQAEANNNSNGAGRL